MTCAWPNRLRSRAAIAVDLSERVSRDSVRRVVEAQELERARLARELHDETGQALTSMLLGLKPLEETAGSAEARAALASVRELVISTLQDVRRLAVELRPKALDDFGLVAAVERLTETFREQSGMQVDLESSIGEDRLANDVETTVYRVDAGSDDEHRQACRRRAGQHPPAAEEQCRGRGGRGRRSGFDPELHARGALGLAGMRERVALAGGRLQVESTPGSGTTMVAEVPLS